MTQKIKLIALDLDATLLDSQKKISPRNLAALERARQMGMVSADEVTHVQMEAVDPDLYQGPGFMERVTAFFDELFAKAPR